MNKLLPLLALLSLSSFTYAATLTSMSSSEAKAALSNKTIKTIAAATLDDKIVENNFIGFFSSDGKLKGSFVNKLQTGPQSDTGTWSVKDNGDVCFKWDHWDSNKERCVTFYKLSNAVLVVSQGTKFETLILDADVQTGDQTGSMVTMPTNGAVNGTSTTPVNGMTNGTGNGTTNGTSTTPPAPANGNAVNY